MTIAVHIDLRDPQNDINTNFNFNCFSILASKFPAHHFIFIFDKPFEASLIREKNITPVLTGPQVRNRLLQHYFYNFKIPRLLNKYNADLFVSNGVCSLRTTIAQFLIIDDLSFLKKKNLFSKTEAGYLKRYIGYFIRKASNIGVMNPTIKTTLQKSFSEDDGKINILNPGIDPIFTSHSFEDAEKTRNSYTDGNQYFLFFATASSASNTIAVLKAFSIFKKWQKSSMQLLILFPDAHGTTAIPGFTTYKHRSDVKIFTAENNVITAAIIAAAYAAIHLPSIDTNDLEGLMCIRSSVPLVTADTDFCRSIYNNNALYAAADEKEISKNLMMLYKDEQFRSDMINSANKLATEYDWEYAADLLWQTIQPYSAATPTFAKK